MSLGTKLAQERRRNNLTQEQLAQHLDVTRQAVSRWESDSAYPETDKIVALARIFGVSCDYLLRDTPEPARAAAGAVSAVTRLLRSAAGRRVTLTFYDGETTVPCTWCQLREFDGEWVNVAFFRKKRREIETEERLIPLSSIRSVTFVKEEET